MSELANSGDQERRKELMVTALHDALGVINLVNIRYLMGEEMPAEELLRQIGAVDMEEFADRMTMADVGLKVLIRDIGGEPYSPRHELYMVGDDAAAETEVAAVEDGGLAGG